MNPSLTDPRRTPTPPARKPAAPRATAQRVRIVNFRLLLGTVLALVLIATMAFFWHRRQVHQQAAVFLVAATEAEKAENWRDAATWLRQYLAHDPDNVDALGRLAVAVDKGAQTRAEQLGAVANYGQVLDKDPQQHVHRARLAELQLLSSPKSALENAQKVLTAEPNNLEALRVRAVALDRSATDKQGADTATEEAAQDVIVAYRAVLDKDPGQTGIARRLADIYRQQAARVPPQDAERRKTLIGEADAVMDRMVAGATDRAGALLARHRYRADYAAGSAATPAVGVVNDDLLEALKFAPQNLEVRLAAAGQLAGLAPNEPLIATRFDDKLDPVAVAEAKDHLLAAITIAPKDARGYLGLSELYLKSGQPELASEPLEAGLRAVGRQHPLLNARLAVLLIQSQRWDDADAALVHLEQFAREAHIRADTSVARRIEAIAQLVRAEWLLDTRNPRHNAVRAAALLKSAGDAGISDSFSAVTATRLGTCHAALRQWDLAVSAFRTAANLQPGEVGPRVAMAEALANAGRHGEAAQEYAAALALAQRKGGPGNPAAIELPLARALFRDQLRLPRDKRDWRRVDDLTARLKESLASSPQVALLVAEVQLARSPARERGAIVDGLKRAEESFTDVPEFWRGAFDLYLRLGQLDSAQKANERLEQLTGRHDPQLRARLLLARGDVAGAEELLRDTSSALDDTAKSATLASLAWLGFQTGKMEQSLEPLQRLAATEPQNIGARFLLAQIAAQSGNEAELKRWVEDLRRLEGPEGSLWAFFQIQLHLLVAQTGNELALKEAATLARQLVSRRPGWYLSHAAEGMINEAQGRPSEAIVSYQRAFELGDRRPLLARRLLSLAILRDEEGQARAILEQMSESTLASPEVLPLAAHVLIRSGDADRAIDLARAAITALPIHAENYIVLGQAVLSSGTEPEQLLQAEQSFRRAVELTPGDVAQWIALLYLYGNFDLPDSSVEGLSALRGALELLAGKEAAPSPTRVSFLLGRALMLVGDPRAANAHFREAVESGSPSDRLVKRIGQMALSTHTLDTAADGAWTGHVGGLPPAVQRVYAMVLLAAGKGTEEIEAILARDQRARAIALAAQGNPRGCDAAAQAIASIHPEQRRRGDWLHLARLRRRAGDTRGALECYAALPRLDPTSEQLREVAQYALDQNELAQASMALEKLNPDGKLSAASLEPKIRLLAAEGKADEAIRVARDFALSEPTGADATIGPARSRQGRLAAECLAKIGKVEEGTALLREVIVGDPLGHTVLADYLSLIPNGRDEALELCLQAASREGAIRQAWFLANIMAQGETNPELQTRAERFFSVVLKEDPRAISSVVLSLAVLREHQNRLDEAIRLTQEALKHEPGNLAHRNNLAWFLSSTGDHEAALELIGGVIEEMGPVPAVLDTKGVALLGARRPAEAARVLEASLDSVDPSPRTHLHLAEAYDAMGLSDEARRSLQTAERHLRGALPPRDQKALERLKG